MHETMLERSASRRLIVLAATLLLAACNQAPNPDNDPSALQQKIADAESRAKAAEARAKAAETDLTNYKAMQQQEQMSSPPEIAGANQGGSEFGAPMNDTQPVFGGGADTQEPELRGDQKHH